MNKTFEIIKKAEQDGDSVILSAKEQISKTKEELSAGIKKIEERYHEQINGLRDKMQRDEKDEIDRRQALLDEKYIEETEAMKTSFSAKKREWLLHLTGKVMSSNGDSGC